MQKRRRVEFVNEIINNVTNDPTFIKRIITFDEMWLYDYEVATVQLSSEWPPKNVPKLKKPKSLKAIPAEAYNTCMGSWNMNTCKYSLYW